MLKALLEARGALSGMIIDEIEDMPSASAYRSRFGSLLRAYQLIGYQPAVDQEKEFVAYNSSWGYGPGWYGGGWYGPSGGTTSGSTSTIYVGQLALDMYAADPKALVWRGVVSKTLDPKAKPEKQQKNLAKSVAKLLKNYPPQVKEKK